MGQIRCIILIPMHPKRSINPLTVARILLYPLHSPRKLSGESPMLCHILRNRLLGTLSHSGGELVVIPKTMDMFQNDLPN